MPRLVLDEPQTKPKLVLDEPDTMRNLLSGETSIYDYAPQIRPELEWLKTQKDDPQAFEDEIVNKAYFANVLQADPDVISRYYPAIVRQNWGEGDIPAPRVRNRLLHDIDSIPAGGPRADLGGTVEAIDPGVFKEDLRIIGSMIKGLVTAEDPYLKAESDKASKEIIPRLKWVMTMLITFGGRVGPKGAKQTLLEEAAEFSAFGAAVVPAASEATQLAVEWGWMYPKMFKAVGMGGEAIAKIPKVQKGMQALKSIGGIEAFAKANPKKYAAINRMLTAFAKGEVVGQTMAAVELLGKDEDPTEWVKKMNKRGALMGGVAATFSLAHSYGQYRYVTETRRLLRLNAYARHVQRMRTGMPETSSADLLRQEGSKIDDVMYYIESEMFGKPTELYGGKRPKLSPAQAAQELARHGFNATQDTIVSKRLGEIKKAQIKRDILNRPQDFMPPKSARTKPAEAATAYREMTHVASGRKYIVPVDVKPQKGFTLSEPIPLEAPPPVKGAQSPAMVEGKDEAGEIIDRAIRDDLIEKYVEAETRRESIQSKLVQELADITDLNPSDITDLSPKAVGELIDIEALPGVQQETIRNLVTEYADVTEAMQKLQTERKRIDAPLRQFEQLSQKPGAKAKDQAVGGKPAKAKDTSPIIEPELTTQEKADIARLDVEIEELYEMVRVKGKGFVIKEKATGKEVGLVPKRKAAQAKLAELNAKGKEIKGTRRKPKVLTGKDTVERLIAESVALKASLKKAAQAARKAFSVGKKEGIAKVREHYRELKVKEKARKELKKRVTKALKTITKETPESVDFAYREAIDALRAGIDPHFRSEKTLKRRERTKEYLSRKPEALKDMPVKLLRQLEKKSVKEYTVEQLEAIAAEIEGLTERGKLKRQLRNKQHRQKLQTITAEIVDAVTKGEPIEIESGPVVFSTTQTGLVKTAFEKTKAWTWRPSRIFDMLDGRQDFSGPAHRFFVDQVNRAVDAKWRMVDSRFEAGDAQMKALGITPTSLAQVRTIGGVRYTVDEMIGVYCADQNRLSRLAIRYGNNLTDKTIESVIANLTENEMAWGDYIIADYEANYDRLREAVIEVENRDMGYEENYTPIRRTEIDYSTHTEEIVDAILQREALRRASTKEGSTIKRKDIPAEYQKPMRLNVTGVWLSQVSKQEQYVHLARIAKDLNIVALSADFRTAVKQQFGPEFNKVIQNYIDRVINPDIYKSYNSLENLSRRLRQNAAVAYLAYNLLTMAKQIPSIFLYMQDAGPTHLLSSAMQFVRDPLGMVKMVQEKDPQVKHRAIERELEELKRHSPNAYARIVSQVGEAGMKGIYMMDAIARTIGWNAVYQKALTSDKSEAEAVRLAQNATLRTQPAASAKDLARLYATNEFLNWFTMFTNQLNQLYNIATYDMVGYIANADYAKAAYATMGLALSALFIWILQHRRLPEDAEDLAEAAGEQAINAIPLFGKSIMAAKRGWGSNELPAFELAGSAYQATQSIVSGDFDNKDLANIAEAAAVNLGLPYIGAKRAGAFIETGKPVELVGGIPKQKPKRTSRRSTVRPSARQRGAKAR